jgi:putative tryptophan/tyrosine transport system substrate-binding protein
MRRREFIPLICGAAVTWCGGYLALAARAQQAGARWRIGQVLGGTPATAGMLAASLEQRLADLGYVQGTNITLDTRFALGQPKAMEDAILSLIANIDLLVVWGTVAGAAAKKLASAKPVVFLSVGAPVEIGLVDSLAHPGGNMTGITFEGGPETYAKRLQILKEIMPSLKRVAVLRGLGDPNVKFAMTSLEKAAPAVGVTMTLIDVGSADELINAFGQIQRSQAEALIVIAGNFTFANGQQIAELALAHHLPSCHSFKATVAVGGLVSLGPDLAAMAGPAASYIDKILRGTKPADLPVQQPTKFQLVINLTTAKALGITVPPSLLARADEVIE